MTSNTCCMPLGCDIIRSSGAMLEKEAEEATYEATSRCYTTSKIEGDYVYLLEI